MCVRNTMLEGIHTGIEPVSHIGDFTNLVVIDENGRRIPWPEMSTIGNEGMVRLRHLVDNLLYPFQMRADDLNFVAMMDRAPAEAWKWDKPELDEIMLSGMESSRGQSDDKD